MMSQWDYGLVGFNKDLRRQCLCQCMRERADCVQLAVVMHLHNVENKKVRILKHVHCLCSSCTQLHFYNMGRSLPGFVINLQIEVY